MKKILNKRKIFVIKNLLEKYSGKTVIIKEFDGDEFYSDTSEEVEDAKESSKPFQLYRITDRNSKDWLGGFDDLNYLKRYAKRSYLNVERQKAQEEDRDMNRNIPYTEQGVPKGYIIEEI